MSLAFEVDLVPAAWRANPIPLIVTIILVIVIILITIVLVKEELNDKKTK